MEKLNSDKASRRSIAGAIVAAVAASICCVGPLVLLALGVGGAWVGNLTALEPYRPFFMIATVLFLAYAFYRVYRRPKEEECEPGSYCANPKSNRWNKIILWTVTVGVIMLLAVPYVTPYLYATGGTSTPGVVSESVENPALCADCEVPGAKVQYQEVVLDVANMTCASCEVTVQKSLTRLEGVVQAEADAKKGLAVVQYDPAKVDLESLQKATTDVGYPSQIRREK